jgi:hypothetical protein
MTEPTPSRRRFLIQAAVAATALPLLARVASQPAMADAPKKLTVDNPQAKALGYVEDAGTTKNAAFKPGSACSNCQFFTAGTNSCAIFAGYTVAPKGWCSAWAKKA